MRDLARHSPRVLALTTSGELESDMAEVDRYDLQRFVEAQASIYRRVTAELRRGEKQTHWMWFIFPQISGLGFSPTSRRFAISSRAEAIEYLDHPVLGPRLRDCSRIVVRLTGRSADDIFGSLDARKFQSCMTLFCLAAEDAGIFKAAIDKYFNGELDPYTEERLKE